MPSEILCDVCGPHLTIHTPCMHKYCCKLPVQMAAHHGGSDGVDAIIAVLRRNASTSEPEPMNGSYGDIEEEEENPPEVFKSQRRSSKEKHEDESGEIAVAENPTGEENRAVASSESDSDVFRVFD